MTLSRDSRILIRCVFVLSLIPRIASAEVRFFTDETTWSSTVSDIETFDTTAQNIALSNQIVIPPGENADLGSVLTWDSANTGLLRSFQLSSVNVPLTQPRGLVFRDQEAVLGGDRNISIGDANGVAGYDRPPYENDDFELSIENGPPLTAFAFVLFGNNSSFDEHLDVLSDGNVMASFTNIPFDNSGQLGQFVGVVSDNPFDRIMFDEDLGGDDISIRDFRFARAVPEPNTYALMLVVFTMLLPVVRFISIG